MSPILILPSRNQNPTYPELVISDGPVSYWRLEQVGTVSTLTDEMGTQDLTSSYLHHSHAGASLVADSTRSFQSTSNTMFYTTITASVASESELNIEGDMSVEVWIYLNFSSGRRTILQRLGGSATNSIEIAAQRIPYPSGPRFLHLATDISGPTVISEELTMGEIYHVVATVERLGGSNALWELYINGVSVGSSTESFYPTQSTNPWYIGRSRVNNAAYYSSERIDEVAIYDKVLSPTQIATHYSVGTSP